MPDITTGQQHAPGIGPQDSDDNAYEGGLARPVGTDQAHELPRAHAEGNPGDGLYPAEADGNIFQLQRRDHVSAFLARRVLTDVANPPGARRITKTSKAPNTAPGSR